MDISRARDLSGKMSSVNLSSLSAEEAFQLGSEAQSTGYLEEAVSYYLFSFSQNPQSFVSALNLSALFLSFGQEELAFLYAQKAYDIEPSNPAVCINYAQAMRRSGQPEKSLKILQKIDQKENFSFYLNLSLGNMAVGKYDLAFPQLEKVLQKKPDYPHIKSLMGICQILQNNQKEGIHLLLQKEGYEPNITQASDFSGKTILLQGGTEEELFLVLRLLPNVQKYGGKLLLQTTDPLKTYIKKITTLQEIFSFDEVLPPYDLTLSPLELFNLLMRHSETPFPHMTYEASDTLPELGNELFKVGYWLKQPELFWPTPAGDEPKTFPFFQQDNMGHYLLNPQKERLHFYHPTFSGILRDLGSFVSTLDHYAFLAEKMDVVIATPGLGALISAASGVQTLVLSDPIKDHWFWQFMGENPWFSHLKTYPCFSLKPGMWHINKHPQEAQSTDEMLMKLLSEQLSFQKKCA